MAEARSVRALPESRLHEATREALRWSRKFCNQHQQYDPEEIESAAVVGAFYAWDRYDPTTRPCKKWEHFLFAHIKWEVQKSVRPRHRQFQALGLVYSLETHLASPLEPDGPSLGEVVPDPHSNFAGSLELGELVGQLPPMEQWVLGQRYFGNMEPRDVAAALNSDTAWVRQLEDRALSQLRALWTQPACA